MFNSIPMRLEELKKAYLERLEYEQEAKKYEEESKQALVPSPKERILQNLSTCKEGNIDAWWLTSYWMDRTPNGWAPNYMEMDVTKLPVWNELEQPVCLQIILLGQEYIVNFDPDSSPWRQEASSIFFPIIAGCRVFRYLFEYEFDSLLSLQPGVFRKWASRAHLLFLRIFSYSATAHERTTANLTRNCGS
ncbi:MAG: hypothetical protein IPL78_18345 [Chloroflexi bacterium]|nr:hypothetical protein [Chloroflexota bacterium]